MLVMLLSLWFWPWSHPLTLDEAGRQAFVALRNYQAAELGAYQRRGIWPTPAQHQAITVKIEELHEFVSASLVLGSDVNAKSPQVASMVRHAMDQVQALDADTGLAPLPIRQLLLKVEKAFGQLEAQFPGPRALEGAPPRR